MKRLLTLAAILVINIMTGLADRRLRRQVERQRHWTSARA